MQELPYISKTKHRNLQTLILEWYSKQKQEYFWREQGTSLYTVFLSEIMLQQTQTSRIHRLLPEFLKQFPTIFALAKATNAEIIIAWRGMGYNSRALRLRDAAIIVAEQYSGKIPDNYKDLIALPGVGDYTATAILCFGWKRNQPVVDVNIRRVYSRLLFPLKFTNDRAEETAVRAAASTIFPENRAAEWHQAIMDIGSRYCTERAPKCNLCPVSNYCKSAFSIIFKSKTKRNEPSFRNIPNRIWRGKIVEILRSKHTIEIESILGNFFPSELHDNDTRTWLAGVLKSLEKDKLIKWTVQNESEYISLVE